MKEKLYSTKIKEEVKKEFSGIEYISDELIEKEFDMIDKNKSFERSIISNNLSLLNLLQKPKNEYYIINKSILSIIKLLEEFISKNNGYKNNELFEKEIFSLGQIYNYTINKEKPYSEDIEDLYHLNSKLQDVNYISEEINYVFLIKDSLYYKLSEQVKKELENECFDTLISMMDENTKIYKIARCALNLCKVDFNKKMIEEILEEAILSYDGKESMNRHIAKLTTSKYKTSSTRNNIVEEENTNDNYNISKIELFGHTLNERLLENQKDRVYVEFLKLKYGLNNDGIFYTNEEIHTILGLDINELTLYYANSINMINKLLEHDRNLINQKNSKKI